MILGVFHSHHDSPEPSIPDIENMRLHRLLSIIAGHSAKGSSDDVRLVAFQAGKAGRIHRFEIGFASTAEPQ
jgi:proteasome lid subunit RPN8/RPN11